MIQGQILVFRAGGMRLGVFLAEVTRLIVEDTIVPVPFAHPAMAGLLVAGDDGPVPVFDLFGLIGETAPPTTRQRTVALFPTQRGPVGLRIEELLGTAASYSALDADATAALHKDVEPALLSTVTGAAQSADGSFSFFSPDAFLAGLGL